MTTTPKLAQPGVTELAPRPSRQRLRTFPLPRLLPLPDPDQAKAREGLAARAIDTTCIPQTRPQPAHREKENTMLMTGQSSGATAGVTQDLPGTPARRRILRVTAMLIAAAATSAVWLLAHAAGASFTLMASGKTLTIGLPAVIGFTLWFSGLGWITLALLERYSGSAAKIWTRLAAGVLLLSLVPIFAEHASAGTRTALLLIHLTVATVLIPVFRHTAAGR
jgi:hypothetical protein